MKKLLALLICLSLLVGYCFTLTACKSDKADTPPIEDGKNDGVTPPDDVTPPDEPDEPDGPTILVPEYKDYGRGTVNFTDIKYSTPDVAAIISGFDTITAAIKANEIPVEEMIAMIVEMEDDYTNYLTMYTLAEINNSRDSANEVWLEEYTYLSTNQSDFSQAVEDMYVAAAQSEHKDIFESDYFGFSLDDYVDGGIYTDEVVELMAKEAELIAEYNGFSTSTVEITLPNGAKGTVDEFMANVSASDYQGALARYMQYYSVEVTRLTKLLYIELVKVRILLAEALGEESYATVGYGNLGHDYSPEAMMSFLSDIKDTIDIAGELYYNNFYHLNYEMEPEVSYVDVVNELYPLFCEMDAEIGDIYAYMLQHGLYDIAPSGGNRLDAAYTTYIQGNNSPFIFMTASERYSDYVTVSHEFGHFTDAFINDGMGASLDLSEVYSQAWSYLMLLRIKDKMNSTDALKNNYKYMLHYEMASLSDILMYQGYLAAFEHMAHALDYDEVTEEKLMELMKEAQIHTWGYEIPDLQVWDAVLIVHTVEYPFYVQSYCTSLVAAVEIMLLEIAESGAGLAAYKTLIDREGYEELTFEAQLDRAGIASPLRDGALIEMFEGVYEFITGKSYSSVSGKLPDAA